MLRVRCMRIGRRKLPFYRVVVIEARKARGASYVAQLGLYGPLLAGPERFKIDLEAYERWLSKGAQPSERVSKLVRAARGT